MSTLNEVIVNATEHTNDNQIILKKTTSKIIKKRKLNKINLLIEEIDEPTPTPTPIMNITTITTHPEIIDPYSNIRSQFGTSEFIPQTIIQIILKHHFESAEILCSFNENHFIYKIKIVDLLLEDKIRNWEYNRPPDMARCPDIARYIYNSHKPIDTMFYLSYNNIKNVFEVIDGIHRITALTIIKTDNLKFCTDIINQYVIVNVRFNATLGDLIEAFKTLNKSQVVPDLYIRDQRKEKLDIINNIANDWQVRYKKHFSSSANPTTGNTNRNKFVELLDNLYDKYNIDELCSHNLIRLLDEANIKIMNNIPSKVTIGIRVRCKESGCYLFLHKNDKLEELI
jgi:hypothetical protein